MPDTERQRLTGQTARVSAGSGKGGGCLVAFSLPFVATGAVVLYLAATRFEEKEGAPVWVFAVIGLVFAVAGAALAGFGVWTAWSARRRKAILQTHPGEPWLADYRWSREGVRDDPPSLARLLAVSVFLAVFLAPFNFFAWFTSEGDTWMPRLIVSVFDLVLVVLLASLVYAVLQRLKYGRSYLAFDAFPFRPGGPLAVRLRAPRGLVGAERIKVVLRAIELVTETRRTSNGTRIETFLDQVWAEELTLDQPTLFAGVDVGLTFDLPPTAPGTDLEGDVPRYWELTVSAETPGIDYATAFVVPVYA